MRAALAILVLLAACDDEPAIPDPSTPIPSAFHHDFDRVPEAGAGMSVVYAYRDSFADGSPGTSFSGAHLFVTQGRTTEGGYVAERLVVGEIVDGFWSSDWGPTATCGGTATFADGAWTIAVTGPAACVRWNGVYRHEIAGATGYYPAVPTEEPPRDPEIVLPAPTTAFARAIARLGELRASSERCPVALRAPDAEVASGDSPGEAALRHAGEATGEPFELMHATSGEMLPSAPESAQRYQVLYVRTRHVAPSVDPGGGTFTAGSSRGRAYLVDVPAERVVCIGDVEATNGDAISAPSERSAAMWLTLQLAIAEERAVALGLFAVAD
jgi:hypothetical protein